VSEDSYAVHLGALGFPNFDPHGFEPFVGTSRKEDEEVLPRHMDFAAALQEVTDAPSSRSCGGSRARSKPIVCALPEALRSIALPMS
jgi:hypothetical protein